MSVDPDQDLRLRVADMAMEAEGVVSLHLTDPDGGPLPAWEPGAHLDLFLPSGLVRQYSLCGDPADRAGYRVAVLREPEGRGGSEEVHRGELAGLVLRARGPRNHFALVDAERYLFVAGGIGITPILPMVAHVAAAGRDWQLRYCGRTRARMAFLAELERHGSRTHVRASDEGPRWEVEQLVAATPPGTAIYCCGPNGLLSAVEEACTTTGRQGDLHLERFAGSGEAPALDADGNRPFEVRLARAGVTLPVPPDRTLLDVVRDAVPSVPCSCEEGYCGSCETRVLEGVPEHHDDILSDEERAEGTTMMICVGRSKSPLLVLDL